MKAGETSRRVKDLAGAFAQLPHLPKMLKADAIIDTLVEGCEQGAFVLRVTRPDSTYRTWWCSRPNDTALKDPALELVLPESAELAEIVLQQLAPKHLPELWPTETITAQTAFDYFGGGKTVQVDKGGYSEAVPIPKASQAVVEKAIVAAVEAGVVWLRSAPASLLAESVPAGVLTPSANLAAPRGHPGGRDPARELARRLERWGDDSAGGLIVAVSEVIDSSTLENRTGCNRRSAEGPVRGTRRRVREVAVRTARRRDGAAEGGHERRQWGASLGAAVCRARC